MAITKFNWGMGGTDESAGFGKKVWYKRTTDPGDVEEFSTRETSEEQVRKDYQNLFNQIQWYLNEKLTAEVEQNIAQQISEKQWEVAVPDNTIVTRMIHDDAVTQSKIADGSVSSAKLADASVTADKLASGAVSTSKLADNAVTAGKIADGTITSAKFATNAAVTGNGMVVAEDDGKKYKAVFGDRRFANLGRSGYYLIALSDIDVEIGVEEQKVINRTTGATTTYANDFNILKYSGQAYRVNDNILLLRGNRTTVLWNPRTNTKAYFTGTGAEVGYPYETNGNLYLFGTYVYSGSSEYHYGLALNCYDATTLAQRSVYSGNYAKYISRTASPSLIYRDGNKVLCREGSEYYFLDITTGSIQTGIEYPHSTLSGASLIVVDSTARIAYYIKDESNTRYIIKLNMDTLEYNKVALPSDINYSAVGSLYYAGHTAADKMVLFGTMRYVIELNTTTMLVSRMSSRLDSLSDVYSERSLWDANLCREKYTCGTLLSTCTAVETATFKQLGGVQYDDSSLLFGVWKYGDKYVQATKQSFEETAYHKTISLPSDIARDLLYFVEVAE